MHYLNHNCNITVSLYHNLYTNQITNYHLALLNSIRLEFESVVELSAYNCNT